MFPEKYNHKPEIIINNGKKNESVKKLLTNPVDMVVAPYTNDLLTTTVALLVCVPASELVTVALFVKAVVP